MKHFLLIVLTAFSFSSQPARAQSYSAQIQSLAGTSACAKYTWKDRGRAPVGYAQGLALNFARALCRKDPLLTAADQNDSRHDALTYYRTTFQGLSLRTDVAGAVPLRALFALAFGEGVRESSGNYCEGWDKSAGANRPSSAGEAGIFQSSYDSIGAAPELQKLYDNYRQHPERCLLNEYKTGASCRAQSILGTGAGADFQSFTKACPAFSTDYAMVLFRKLRTHFGPINRHEAEVVPDCEKMLYNVQALVEAHETEACAELAPAQLP